MVVFLSIAEIDGNTTAISEHVSTGAGPRTTLHENVFCVLSASNPIHQPFHTQTFSPRHMSSLTLQLRTYNPATNTYENYPSTSPKIGLWFKLVTDDC
jgi:hypothetical protein